MILTAYKHVARRTSDIVYVMLRDKARYDRARVLASIEAWRKKTPGSGGTSALSGTEQPYRAPASSA